MKKVLIKVVGGKCQGNFHEVGDTFEVGSTTPQGICLGAFGSIMPYLIGLRFEANFPWEKEEGVATIKCPDPIGITLELRRR